MALLPQSTLDFLATYSADLPRHRKAAKQAEEFVAAALDGKVPGIHLVTGRPKDPLSLLDKLRRKGYADPAGELRDLVGVRVITYHTDDAEKAASIVRPMLEIDEPESFDKLEQLGPLEFGYRSIHLVGRIPEGQDDPVTATLGTQWFEIQFRSLLQHAWAEVEHEAVYKSGIDLPAGLHRQFGALAGALETLDQAFIGLRAASDVLAAEYRDAFASGEGLTEPLDVPRLSAFLEHERPNGPTLAAAPVSVARHARYPKLVTDAVKAAGIQTAEQLRAALSRAEVERYLKTHAASIGATTDELSHLIVLLVVVWVEMPDLLKKQFPELRFDPELGSTLGFDLYGSI